MILFHLKMVENLLVTTICIPLNIILQLLDLRLVGQFKSRVPSKTLVVVCVVMRLSKTRHHYGSMLRRHIQGHFHVRSHLLAAPAHSVPRTSGNATLHLSISALHIIGVQAARRAQLRGKEMSSIEKTFSRSIYDACMHHSQLRKPSQRAIASYNSNGKLMSRRCKLRVLSQDDFHHYDQHARK